MRQGYQVGPHLCHITPHELCGVGGVRRPQGVPHERHVMYVMALSASNNWRCLHLTVAIVRRACITGYTALLLLCHIIQPSALIRVRIESQERSCYIWMAAEVSGCIDVKK